MQGECSLQAALGSQMHEANYWSLVLRHLLLVAAVVLTPATLHAQASPPAAPEVAAPAKAASEKLVCRREEGLGSRLGTKVCRTRAEWTAIRKKQTGGAKDGQEPEEF